MAINTNVAVTGDDTTSGTQAWIWILIGIGVVGTAGLSTYLILKKKRTI